MSIHKAASELARTLLHTPGFVRVGVDGDTIVLVTAGGGDSLRSWAGHPVRRELNGKPPVKGL